MIINADSQQVYADLRILTARPGPEEEALVPHKLYGFLPAHEACSAGKWLRFARMEIDWALANGALPIVVGGTGLYIKALLEGIAEMPDIPPEVRAQAVSDYDAMGREAFAERLKAVDPEFFNRLKVCDRQRLVRAYEVWLGSGKTLTWWQKQGSRPAYPKESFDVMHIDIAREELYRRCNERLELMVEQGALEEVKHLLSLNIAEDAPIMKSVGVKDFSAYLHGKETLGQALDKAKQTTRHYAKRQLTWFRHQLPFAKRIAASAL